MTDEEKLTLIQKYEELSEEEFKEECFEDLKKFAFDKDDTVKTFTASVLSRFVNTAKQKEAIEILLQLCHEENELKKQQKTAIITLDENNMITSYEEKPKKPKGNLAVPPFYYYRGCDVKRIHEALDDGCGYDAPGSFAAWLSKQTDMHAYCMPGKRYDIGDINSYTYVKSVFTE